MGVRGLKKLADGWMIVWESLALQAKADGAEAGDAGKAKRIKLVIDGSAFVYFLWEGFDKTGVPYWLTSDYRVVKSDVEKFVKRLRNCGIEPMFVFDGANPEIKRKTAMKRHQERVRAVHQMTLRGLPKDRRKVQTILPPLAMKVVESSLQSLGVRIVKAEGEADAVVAGIARTESCCAVSNDSDLFIMDVPLGVIPLGDLMKGLSDEGVRVRKLKRDLLAKALGVDVSLLPLLASLSGNDYVTDEQMERVHTAVRKAVGAPTDPAAAAAAAPTPTSTAAAAAVKDKPQMEHIMSTLARFCAQLSEPTNAAACEAAVWEAAVQEGLPETLCPALKELVASSIASYQDTSANSRLQEMPSWVGKAFKEGSFDEGMLSILFEQEYRIDAVIEDNALESVMYAVRPIRAALYSILLNGSATRTSEYIRVGRDIKQEALSVGKEVAPGIPSPSLAQVGSMSPEDRLRVFLGALGADTPEIRALPSDLILPAAAMRFLCMNGCIKTTHAAATLLLPLVAPIPSDDETWSRVDAAEVDARSDWCRCLDRKWERTQMDSSNLLSCWQACLFAAKLLNDSLARPAEEPKFWWIMRGAMQHRLLRLLNPRQKLSPGSRIQLLAGCEEDLPGAAGLLEKLWAATTSGSPVGGTLTYDAIVGATFTSGSSSGPAKAGSKEKDGSAAGQRNLFSLLGDDDEEEDTEAVEEAPSAPVVAAPAPEFKKKQPKVEEVDEATKKLDAMLQFIESDEKPVVDSSAGGGKKKKKKRK